MGKVNKTNSYTEFFYKAFRNVLIVSIPLVIISAIVLSSLHSSARTSSSDSLAISVPSSCTLSSSVDEAHSASIVNGRYEEDIGTTTLSTFCNDGNGYSIYAIGDSLNSEGNNVLVGDINNNYDIPSGTATSGDTSNWAMKLSLKAGDTSTTPPSIIDPFTNYSTVPTYWTRVATIPASTTDMKEGSSFTTTYATYISPTQAAGTYLGQVKYLLTHPSAATPTSAYIMQEVADWEDELTNEGDSVVAFDNRDGKSYWVTKLADGHIWMTQNLDFDIDTTRTYTHNDTDLGWDPNSFDINATWKPDTTNGRYNLPVNGTSVPDWSNQNNYPYSADPGNVYYYTSNSEANDIKYNSLSECIAANHTEGDCKHYHAGNYYNWTAAIASNNSSSLTTRYANAPNSICPKGWRLPIANSNNQTIFEFGDLFYTYYGITQAKFNTGSITDGVSYTNNGFINIRKSPLWFVRSGRIDTTGKLERSNALGTYWSSVVDNSNNAYNLHFVDSGVWPANNYQRPLGRSVRCVAR